MSSRRPYYKALQPSELDATPTFQTRKNLADVVKFNMQTIGRRFYYQRLILITRHKNTSAPFLKDVFAKPINRCKCTSGDEKMTALLILFDSYTVQMLEGPEEMINAYIRELAPLEAANVIKQSRIVLNYTNINQKFFRRVLWRIAEFPSYVDQLPDDVDKKLYRCQSLILKTYDLCTKVRLEEVEDTGGFKSSYLSANYRRITPTQASLDALLELNELQTISDYSGVISQPPAFYGFAESVWPISHDFTPHNVFDWGDYDINLNFWQNSESCDV